MSHEHEQEHIWTKYLVDIIIPTVDNPRYLQQCLTSILENTRPHIFRILIANNGTPKSLDSIKRNDESIKVFDMGTNKGWEGGINEVLPHVEAPFTCLLNDDTFILPNDVIWLMKMLSEFKDPEIGAVGPSSNHVMQKQNVFWQNLPRRMNVSLLIGFCLLIRTDLFKKLGGLAKDLPGGDDLDLSMRIEKEGYKLRLIRDAFVYHHGASTGQRIHGSYWDSEEHQDKTNNELIRRNGLKSFMRCRFGSHEDVMKDSWKAVQEDAEGEFIRSYIPNGELKEAKVLDIGCGANKTTIDAVGIDLFHKGNVIPSLDMSGLKSKSQADIVSVADKLPFEDGSIGCVIARHIFEHVIDPVIHLQEWSRIIMSKGRLIIALPDHEISSTIPLNPEHVHAYSKSSFRSLMKAILPDFKEIITQDANNGISFVAIYDKQ